MFKILVDTCVWLDIAKDYRQRALIEAVEYLHSRGEIELLVPRIVLDEFARNKERVAADGSRSLSSALKRAREIVGQLGEGRGKRVAIAQLENVDHRLPQLGEVAIEAIGKIESLLAKSTAIESSEEIIMRAARRAIQRKAPFHRQRNSMADAMILEMYLEISSSREARTRYAFVTHNTKDFSQEGGDLRVPHQDIAPAFSRIRSLYLTSLAEAVRRVDPRLVTEIMLEQEGFEEPRRLGEVLAAVEEFTDKVWYGRHGLLHEGVESGTIRLVSEGEEIKDRARSVRRDIYAGARRAAKRVEKRYGTENLGPWSDFEWGMLSGKLSALRWVLGDEWDNLDT